MAPASADARANPSAVLLGEEDDSGVQRVANELRAAAYDVVIAPDSVATTDAELGQVARDRGVRAVVRIQGSAAARQVVVYIVSSTGSDSTLRRLTPRARPGGDAEGVLALRVVEVVNAALQELDREAMGQQQTMPPVSRPAPVQPGAVTPQTRLSLGGGVRALWLPSPLPALVGPELAGRIRASWGLFGEASSFVSASSARFARESGSTTVRTFSAGLEFGYAGFLSQRVEWGVGLGAACLGSWADAAPASGYTAREAFARSALFHAGGELALKLTRKVRLATALDAGLVLPRLELAMAGASVAEAPWLGAASLSLAMEWEP